MKQELVILQWWQPQVRPDHAMDEYWDHMIHPNDLNIACNHQFKSAIFCIEGHEGEFVVLKQLGTILRVKNTCLKYIDYEGFYLGDKVKVVSNHGKNTPREGYIANLSYHFKENRLTYFLVDQHNCKLTKRYFSDDLEKI